MESKEVHHRSYFPLIMDSNAANNTFTKIHNTGSTSQHDNLRHMSQKSLSMPCNNCKVIKTDRKGSESMEGKIKEGSGIAFTIICLETN